MRILIGTDGSRQSSAALISACRMLGSKNRLADLVCVTPKVPDHGKHPHRERLYRRAQYIVDQTKAMLAGEGVTTVPAMRTGSAARILVGASRNYNLTIVAASSDGTGGGLGPIASRVAEHAHGAVLLAREGNGSPGMRVLAAVDGSESANSALQIMAELMDLRDAEVTLLHVIETPWLHADSDREWFGYEEEERENDPQVQADPQVQIEEVFKKEADEILLAARDRLPADTTILTVVREGLPADEILSEADGGYDLVVLGVSGVPDMKQKMLGSVSSKVAWNTPCSVLLAGSAADRE